MKKKITITIVIILVLLLIAGAAVWYFVFHNSDRIGRDAATEAALSDAGFTRRRSGRSIATTKTTTGSATTTSHSSTIRPSTSMPWTL